MTLLQSPSSHHPVVLLFIAKPCASIFICAPAKCSQDSLHCPAHNSPRLPGCCIPTLCTCYSSPLIFLLRTFFPGITHSCFSTQLSHLGSLLKSSQSGLDAIPLCYYAILCSICKIVFINIYCNYRSALKQWAFEELTDSYLFPYLVPNSIQYIVVPQ